MRSFLDHEEYFNEPEVENKPRFMGYKRDPNMVRNTGHASKFGENAWACFAPGYFCQDGITYREINHKDNEPDARMNNDHKSCWYRGEIDRPIAPRFQ